MGTRAVRVCSLWSYIIYRPHRRSLAIDRAVQQYETCSTGFAGAGFNYQIIMKLELFELYSFLKSLTKYSIILLDIMVYMYIRSRQIMYDINVLSMYDVPLPLNRDFFHQTHVYSGHVSWPPLRALYNDVQ